MESPIAQDKATVEKYEVPAEVELHPRQKIAFLEEQLHQLKSLHWRARVDMLHSKRLQGETNEVLQNKGLQNYNQHLNEMQQTIGGIKMISTYLEELRKEFPELGEVSSAEHPDGF